MRLTEAADDVAEFEQYLTDSFDRKQTSLRSRCFTIFDEASLSEARDVAWELLRDVFGAWCHFERGIAHKTSPAE